MRKNKLPLLSQFNLQAKTVLVRTDYDVPLKAKKNQRKQKIMEVADDTRILMSLSTIKYLLKKNCRIILLSHLDRPGGKIVSQLSLKPVFLRFRQLLPKTRVNFSGEILGEKTRKMLSSLCRAEILMLENLRFRKEEEENKTEFAQSLASLGNFYINEAFADSHRSHSSIVGIPKFLPSAAGFELAKEVAVLNQVYKHPQRPLVVVLGGKKKDKINFLKKLSSWADFVLIGGLLPKFLPSKILSGKKIISASLTKTNKDIKVKDAYSFSRIINKAATIVLNGTMGAFEEKNNRETTKIIAQAIANSKAFKIAGGGDTEAALTVLGLKRKFDFISSGGGAMLKFLALGDLPGLEALRK